MFLMFVLMVLKRNTCSTHSKSRHRYSASVLKSSDTRNESNTVWLIPYAEYKNFVGNRCTHTDATLLHS